MRKLTSALLAVGIASASLCKADDLIFATGFEWDSICPWAASTNPVLCDDPLPADTVAWFYRPTCPTGWVVYAPAMGRTIVPSTAGDAGTTDGLALASGEDRSHDHSVSSSLVIPGPVSYAGLPGCCNMGVGQGGMDPVVGTASAASLGIPYVQLLACRKTVAPGAGSIPDSALLFFVASSCPAGFADPSTPLERLVVGLPPGGTPGASFGGPDLATASHAHSIAASFAVPPHGIALVSNGAAAGYAAPGLVPFADDTAATASVFPYLEMLACTSTAVGTDADLLPAGLLLLVEAADCPPGWIPSPRASGRLIVSALGADVGVAVGVALGDQEDRTHQHAFDISLTLPAQSIAAVDGGNTSGAQSGATQATGVTGSSTSGLPFVQIQACERVAFP